MKMNQTGRSMVEMLGVLAIIGVLSVGGIAAYTTAMNRYKANEILNTASMMAVMARSANGGQGRNIESLEEVALAHPYGRESITMEAEYNDTTRTVNVTVDGVENSAICDSVESSASTDSVNLYHIECDTAESD